MLFLYFNLRYFWKNYSTKKGVKYPFKVRFRSFKSLNIKMSHSVVQKNHLQSGFMSIFSWFMGKLLFSIFVKHPVYQSRFSLKDMINKVLEYMYRCEQRYYMQDGNYLTYNVSVKSLNLSILLFVYCLYIQKLVVSYVGFYDEFSFPIKKYM